MHNKHKSLIVLISTCWAAHASKELKDMVDAQSHLAMRDPFSWLEIPLKLASAPQPKVHKKQPVVPSIPVCPWVAQSVSLSAKPCALLVSKGQSRVVRCNDDIGQGWQVKHITAQAVVIHHQAGTTKELLV